MLFITGCISMLRSNCYTQTFMAGLDCLLLVSLFWNCRQAKQPPLYWNNTEGKTLHFQSENYTDIDINSIWQSLTSSFDLYLSANPFFFCFFLGSGTELAQQLHLVSKYVTLNVNYEKTGLLLFTNLTSYSFLAPHPPSTIYTINYSNNMSLDSFLFSYK